MMMMDKQSWQLIGSVIVGALIAGALVFGAFCL